MAKVASAWRFLDSLRLRSGQAPSVATSFDFAQDRLPFSPFGFAQGKLLGMTGHREPE
jgi:hypothetical protein